MALWLLLALFIILVPAHATWKPEYGQAPIEVQDWFKAQLVPTESAQARLGFSLCCDHSDRVKTKFLSNGSKDEWWYQDPDTGKMVRIPDDVIHYEDIPAGSSPEAQETFRQMRAEGILMVYNGKITCFWPPETGI